MHIFEPADWVNLSEDEKSYILNLVEKDLEKLEYGTDVWRRAMSLCNWLRPSDDGNI